MSLHQSLHRDSRSTYVDPSLTTSTVWRVRERLASTELSLHALRQKTPNKTDKDSARGESGGSIVVLRTSPQI